MRLFLEAQVSPADLKSLPNLPGYTFPESLSRSVWLEAPPSIRVILCASVWLISAFIKLPLPRAYTKNSRWFFFYLPRYKDNYLRQNSWNLVNGVRIEQKDGVSHDKPKFVKAGPGELRCGSKLKTPLSNQSFLFLRFVFFKMRQPFSFEGT